MSELYPDLPYTKFPGELDNMTQMMNITASDLPTINLFHYYLRNGDFEAAQLLFKTVPDIDKKLIDSTRLNQLRDAMIALERFYKTDVKPYTDEKSAEWLMKVMQFSYKGIWDDLTTYEAYNLVSYQSGEDVLMFIATKDVAGGTGINITNTEYWTQFTIRGERGESGAGGAFRYNWSATESYNVNDTVVYGNYIWGAKQANTNSTPKFDGSNTDWEELFRLPSAHVPVFFAFETPTGLDEGNMYFELDATYSGINYENSLKNMISNRISMTSIDFPSGITAIDEYAFYKCESLALTKIPDSITIIKANAFRGCTNLALTKLPDEIVTLENYSFGSCTSLITIRIGSKIQTISNNSFNSCTNLTTIYINLPRTTVEAMEGYSSKWGATNATIICNDDENWVEA